MQSRLLLVAAGLILSVVITGIPLHGADIIWVHQMRGGGDADPETFNGPGSGEGLLTWEDDQWRNLLESNGHSIVEHAPFDLLETDDGTQLDLLNTADIVIVSRDSNSGDYANDPIFETLTWNEELNVPLMLMTPYITRSNRWDWVASTSIVNSTGAMTATAPNHDIFANVALNGDNAFDFHSQLGNRGPNPDTGEFDDSGEFGQDNIDLVDADFGPNANVLAVDEAGLPWIATWDEGDQFYPGSTGGFAGAARMYFSAGSDDDPVSWGEKNITRAGDQLFLNAVALLTGEEAPVLPSDNVCGDFDMDGDIDAADRTIQTVGWTGAMAPGTGGAVFTDGDCDADGDVDTADQTGLIGNWTGAMAGGLEDDGDVDLIYDPESGNVTLDASDAASGVVLSFVLGTGQDNMRSENFVQSADGSAGPFIDVGTNTDATAFQIGQTDPLGQGAGPTIDLGDILPAGMDQAGLSEYLTLAQYASALGAGGELDLVVVPEPSSISLILLGLLVLRVRLNERRR